MCSNLPAPLWCHTPPGPSCPEILWPWKGGKKGLGCIHAVSVLPSTGQMREDRKGFTLPVNGTKWSGTSSFARCQQINRRIPQSAKHWNKKRPTPEEFGHLKWTPTGVQSSVSILYFLKQFHSNNSSPTRKWQLLAPHHVDGSFYLCHLPGHCEAACLPGPLTSDHLSEESHWCLKP